MVDVTVVSPFFNEASTLEELAGRVTTELNSLNITWELILVDDGSTDDGYDVALQLMQENSRIRAVRFLRNFGKAAALTAGFRAARGRVIVTMDADLQDDPAELPRFLGAIGDGVDVVTGWKRVRHDPVHKTVPSRIFNWAVARAFGIQIHDINCGYKAYTRRAAEKLTIYGELHRFTPALLHAIGFSFREIEVRHHPRKWGHSKYGITRLIKGFLDLFTVMLISKYGARPLHFFSFLGIPLTVVGGGIIAYLSLLWLIDMGPIGDRPLLLMGVLFVLTGVQLLAAGLIAELVQARLSNNHDFYVIDRADGFEP